VLGVELCGVVLAAAAPAAGAVVVVVVVWVLCALSVVVAGAAAEASAAGVVLVVGAAAEAEESAAGAVLEAAGVVLEAEGLAAWLASGAACIAPPDPEAVESVVAVGCAPLGAAALSFAEGTGALLLFSPESVTGAVEFGLEGRLESVLLAEAAGAAAADGAAEAPALLQDSAIIFMSETLNLLSEPIVPVNEAWCPTCASRPVPSSLYATPFWSVTMKLSPDLLTQPLMDV
jgi:hypothetical protein